MCKRPPGLPPLNLPNCARGFPRQHPTRETHFSPQKKPFFARGLQSVPTLPIKPSAPPRIGLKSINTSRTDSRGAGQSPLSPNELSARPTRATLPLVHENCSWTIAVVLLHRKMTMERAEPISTTWRMFIFLANAKTTAIPNKTLLGSQGTATANRIVI